MVGFVEALKRQSGAKDVVINFKKGTAEAEWKKAAKFDYQALKKTVNRSAELTFRAVEVTARGKVTEHEGRPALEVTATNELFFLAEEPKVPRQSPLRELVAAGQPGRSMVSITGRVQEPNKGPKATQPLTLIVEQWSADVATR